MAPWKLPLVVVAIAVPVIVAFYAGGPGVGVGVGALAAVGIVALAVRQRPRGAIGAPAGAARRVLVVICQPAEDAEVVRQLAAAVEADGEAAETLVLSPARLGFLDRWASDLEEARRQAQQRLVITIASLAKAGIVAEARVGDEDLTQAVEDQLQGFAATDLILIAGDPEEDPAATAAAVDLQARFRGRFRQLRVSGPAAR
jgi:hypothetical protein